MACITAWEWGVVWEVTGTFNSCNLFPGLSVSCGFQCLACMAVFEFQHVCCDLLQLVDTAPPLFDMLMLVGAHWQLPQRLE